MLVYDIDRLATRMIKISKSADPGEMPSREELIDHITQLQYRYKMQEKKE